MASENELRHVDPYKASHQDGQGMLGNLDPSNRIHAVDLFYNDSQTLVFWASLHMGAIYRRRLSPLPRSTENTRRKRQAAGDAAVLVSLSVCCYTNGGCYKWLLHKKKQAAASCCTEYWTSCNMFFSFLWSYENYDSIPAAKKRIFLNEPEFFLQHNSSKLTFQSNRCML